MLHLVKSCVITDCCTIFRRKSLEGSLESANLESLIMRADLLTFIPNRQ